ncbi:hypothetical protein FOE78_06755 [Microlunatus elymi]|uniref:Phospholipase C n=1 Tax=Microlunatus elymi TaxID=2596828 RepID=A0A516PWU8_9ACTN|nr:alkaline phosphatase family protein [Microlunatus elymi]QDP95646.1 hypothetical protein FOE78_06755 [Microlunatus elymi]
MSTIDHVVVLALENRSFDHMLGFLAHPDPAFDGLLTAEGYSNPGWNGGPAVVASPIAKRVLPVGPDHSHNAVMEQLAVVGSGAGRKATNTGFVASYERKGRGLVPPPYRGLLAPLLNLVAGRLGSSRMAANRGPLVMQCQPPAQVPVLSELAREYAVCTRWFCSVPGETWPNRNFLHAATSDGATDIELRFYANRTIFEVLEEAGCDWRIYHDDTPQVWAFPRLWDTPERHARWFPLADFARHVAEGSLPNYTFIEPNHRPPLHTLDHEPLVGVPDVSNNQHPENNLVSDAAYDGFVDDGDTDFARAEQLLAMVYEALRGNPALFEHTVLLVTYDEHGGLYDHVPPPCDVPAPGSGSTTPPERRLLRLAHALLRRSAAAFDFTMLGPRVPTVVISPLVPAGTVDARIHDHATVPATLRLLFAPDEVPLTARDAWAQRHPFHTVMTLDRPRSDLPDLSGYLPPKVGSADVSREAPGGRPETARVKPWVPEYYDAFMQLGRDVSQRLASVGEPEVVSPGPTPTVASAAQVSTEFALAAERHRRQHGGE